MPFDPKPKLTKISGKDYLEVKWRFAWINEDVADQKVRFEFNTKIVDHDKEAAFCLAEAIVHIYDYETEKLIKRGHDWGQETGGDFGDYIEKAVTKAMGRALAQCGYGTQFGGDFDMKTRGGREALVDSPVGDGSASTEKKWSGFGKQKNA